MSVYATWVIRYNRVYQGLLSASIYTIMFRDQAEKVNRSDAVASWIISSPRGPCVPVGYREIVGSWLASTDDRRGMDVVFVV